MSRAAPLRLAAVSDAVYPWHHGGKEMRQQELWRRLVQRGVRVDVYTMKWWGKGSTYTSDGITYHAICPRVPLYSGQRRSIRQAVLFALAVLRLLFRRMDVIEVDALPYLHMPFIRVVSIIRRVPLVATWHEFWGRKYWSDYLGPAGALAARVERGAAAMSDAIVAASQLTANRIRERNPGVRLYVIENGVDGALIERVRDANRPADERYTLLVVGRLLTHKNVDIALRALALSSHAQACLSVIGVGPEMERLVSLSHELGIENRVSFEGRIDDHEEVLRRVADARLLVFPSVREGFGMVAAEAICLGTPVVTSDAPDNAARLLVSHGHDGLICAPQPHAVAAAIDAAWDCTRHEPATVPQRWEWEWLADRLFDALVATATAPVGSQGARR